MRCRHLVAAPLIPEMNWSENRLYTIAPPMSNAPAIKRTPEIDVRERQGRQAPSTIAAVRPRT